MINSSKQRPTWLEINLENLVYNYHSIKNFIGDEIKFMAVIKADGYGHGALECALRLEKEKVDWFAVALPEEGIYLRENGIKTPILCLGGFWNGQENLILDYDLTPVIYQEETARILNNAARKRKININVHIKIDTGMGRIGRRFDEVKVFVEELKKLENVRIDGLMTHFASADDLSQIDFTNLQKQRFDSVVEYLAQNNIFPSYIDLANSPAAVSYDSYRGNLVRIGGILYGLGDDVLPQEIKKPDLKPVLSLYSQITHIKRVPAGESLGYSRTFITQKDSLIATIPIGYHDGYRRNFSNKSRVIIDGTYAPVVGRISMDWTIVDITDIPNAKIGDTVVLIGKQNDLTVKAEELAKLIDTISYEITCGINSRVNRIYLNEQPGKINSQR